MCGALCDLLAARIPRPEACIPSTAVLMNQSAIVGGVRGTLAFSMACQGWRPVKLKHFLRSEYRYWSNGCQFERERGRTRS